jgi:hypothetical protein
MLTPLGHHLVFRAVDSRVIAPHADDQRRLARTLLRVGEDFGLVAFRASGDHLHVECLCDRLAAGRFAQTVGSSLTQQLDLPGFLPVWFEPLVDQRHVENTFAYVLGNAEKHGAANDPLHEASSIGVTLGLSVGPGRLVTRVRGALPKVSRAQLLRILGVRELEPGFRLADLADAAAGAVLLPRLDQTPEACRARRAAVRVALPHAPAGAIAAALECSERTIRRFRAGQPEPTLERAIALRMGHRAALGERASVATLVGGAGAASR